MWICQTLAAFTALHMPVCGMYAKVRLERCLVVLGAKQRASEDATRCMIYALKFKINLCLNLGDLNNTSSSVEMTGLSG